MPLGIYVGPPGLAFRTIYDTFRLFTERMLFNKFIAARQPQYSRVRAPLPPDTAKGLVISDKT
jgi:hypothetical protein